MVNTLSDWERIGAGLHSAPLIIKVTEIIVQEADQPDLVLDLTNAYQLTAEDGTQVDAFSDAAAPTARDPNGSVMQRIVGLIGQVPLSA